MTSPHRPVLLERSADALIVRTTGNYIDATIGFGGHSERFLERLDAAATLIGLDADQTAFEYCRRKFNEDARVKLYDFNFTKIDVAAKIEAIDSFDGVFADLGVSSRQLDDPAAGFSYRHDGPLDMRMSKSLRTTAADVVNRFDERRLADLFFQYGEERASRRIARAVVSRRKQKSFKTSFELASVVERAIPAKHANKSLARIFQALRIYVNDEIEALRTMLEKAVDLLAPGGRLAVISYHSLEDRVVKEFIKREAADCVCPPESPVCRCDKKARLKPVERKPIAPDEKEVRENPRARSAKLRTAERL
ncbi:MAG: 16S rRNA (cytosine(1402)-N(4))-methyltransferase RsmH [Ignavibacteriales bacterium]|nr:16S rRNA (cytosine(1402)-N(4))-methyltransferase RsmH [Ignavibacteriales bacterium]